MVLGTERVSGIDENRMRFVNTTYYRSMPGRPSGAVALWTFGRCHEWAKVTVANKEATEHLGRAAVRTAILLARPEKS